MVIKQDLETPCALDCAAAVARCETKRNEKIGALDSFPSFSFEKNS